MYKIPKIYEIYKTQIMEIIQNTKFNFDIIVVFLNIFEKLGLFECILACWVYFVQ